MRKNIFKIGVLSILTFGGVLTLNSCRDAIDIVQEGEINEDVFFSSVENLKQFLLTVYANVDVANANYMTSLITDELKRASSNAGHQLGIHRLEFTADEGFVASIWLEYNNLINFANRLIEGAKKITPTTAAETAEYNKTVAEARVLRAFAHMQLLTYFSEDMKDDSKLGSILFDFVPTVSTKLPRNTNGEVFAAIEEDLEFAYDKLDQKSRYRVSQSMVDAMRARIALYRGKYADAKTHAEKAIANSGLSLTPAGTYTDDASFYAVTTSTSPYRAMWIDAAQGEAIFSLARPSSGGSYNLLASFYNTNNSTRAGSPKWAMGYNLYNILKDTEGDIRFKAFVDPSSNPSNSAAETDDLIIDKYPGKTAAPLRNDLKIFRISEMKFIIAEAQAEAGDFVGAATTIQEVREARNYKGKATTPVYARKEEAIDDILKERRVELAFEGHRLIDLKRRGKSTDRSKLDDDVNITDPAKTGLSVGNHRFTLPIPSREIGSNPIKQNSGY